MKSPRGAKAEIVEAAIDSFEREFAISDLEKACSGVSRDMIRIVMNRLRKEGRLKILGRGRDARWAKLK